MPLNEIEPLETDDVVEHEGGKYVFREGNLVGRVATAKPGPLEAGVDLATGRLQKTGKGLLNVAEDVFSRLPSKAIKNVTGLLLDHEAFDNLPHIKIDYSSPRGLSIQRGNKEQRKKSREMLEDGAVGAAQWMMTMGLMGVTQKVAQIAAPHTPRFFGGMKEIIAGGGLSTAAGMAFGPASDKDIVADQMANVGEGAGGIVAAPVARQLEVWAKLRNASAGRARPMLQIVGMLGEMPSIRASALGRVMGAGGGYGVAHATGEQDVNLPVVLSVVTPGLFEYTTAARHGKIAGLIGDVNRDLSVGEDVSSAAMRVTTKLENELSPKDLYQASVINNSSPLEPVSRETIHAFTNDAVGQTLRNRAFNPELARQEASRRFTERHRLMPNQFEPSDIDDMAVSLGLMSKQNVFPVRHAADLQSQKRGSVLTRIRHGKNSGQIETKRKEIEEIKAEQGPPAARGDFFPEDEAKRAQNRESFLRSRKERIEKVEREIAQLEKPDISSSQTHSVKETLFGKSQRGASVSERYEEGRLVSRRDTEGPVARKELETKIKYLDTKLSNHPFVQSLNEALSNDNRTQALNEMNRIMVEATTSKQKMGQFADLMGKLQKPSKDIEAYLPQQEARMRLAEKLKDVFWYNGVLTGALADVSPTNSANLIFNGDKLAEFMEANQGYLKDVYGATGYQARRDLVDLLKFRQLGSVDEGEKARSVDRVMSFVSHRLVFQLALGAGAGAWAGYDEGSAVNTFSNMLLGAGIVHAGGKGYVMAMSKWARMAERSPREMKALVGAMKRGDATAQGRYIRAIIRTGDPEAARQMGIGGSQGNVEEPGPVAGFFSKAVSDRPLDSPSTR